MNLSDDIIKLSREQLYLVINQLKCENNCLKTDLIKYKLLSNCYQKYYEVFNEINETIASNKQILISRERLDLRMKTSFDSIKHMIENCHKLCAQDFLKNISDETMSGQIDGQQTQNDCINQCFKLNDISLEENHPIVMNDSQTEDFKIVPKSEPQILHEENVKTRLRNRSNRKRTYNSMSGKSEDNDSNCSDNSETDLICGEKMDSNSDEEFKIKSMKQLKTGRMDDSKQVFRCDWEDCSAVLHTIKSLNAHRIRHSGKFMCGVGDCEYKGKDSYDLKRHNQRMHMNIRPFVCSYEDCDRDYKTKEDLIYHIKYGHKGGDSPLLTQKSSKRQKSKTLIRYKQLSVEKAQQPGPKACAKCEESSHFFGLGCHIHTESVNQNSVCNQPECDQNFFGYLHLKRVHGRATYDCPLCPK